MIRWKLKNVSGDPPEKIHPVLFRLLQNRKIDPSKAEDFLAGEKGEWFSPALLPDIEPAAKAIRRVMASGGKITVYGDYDVDGVTSVAMMTRFFAAQNIAVSRYIPNRQEGYGLNRAAVEKIRAGGTELLITVDTGTTAADEVSYAKSLGMEVVVTDHHECGGVLPDCPVVNPKRPDSVYPFSELAGVGVAFKLICYLSSENEDILFARYGEYAAVGTIADIMPLVSENRVIAARGLEALKHPSVGFSALKDLCSKDGDLDSSAVAFRIAPRLNAAGRVGSPNDACDLLLCDDRNRADFLAEKLCSENDLRRETEAEIMAGAEKQIALRDLSRERLIIEGNDDWHPGVLGIVASRLVEKYHRPCILFCRDQDQWKGSARSLDGVGIYDLLSVNRELLSRFGGHAMAAGLSLPAERFEDFRRQMQDYALTAVDETLLCPSLEAECVLEEEYCNVSFCRDISALEPFGAGNPQPVFWVKDLSVVAVNGVSGGKHTRITFQTVSGSVFHAMMFGVEPECAGCLPGDRAEVICTVSENVFRGRSSFSMFIKSLNLPDFEKAFAEDELLWQEYCQTGVSARKICRDDVAAVYRAIRGLSRDGLCKTTLLILCRSVSSSGRQIGAFVCRLCLAVLEELGLVRFLFSPTTALKEGRFLKIELLLSAKTELTSSRIFRTASGAE